MHAYSCVNDNLMRKAIALLGFKHLLDRFINKGIFISTEHPLDKFKF